MTVDDERAATVPDAGSPHDGPVPHRVLIVDDDRAIRESLARALELEGYDVDVVVDGVHALARTRRETFDALVVDVMMPGIDGLGVCRVLRADGDRTPVLMLTARVETPDRVAGLDAGADDYLPKPFELDELLARLRALLRRHADRAESLSLGRRRLDLAARRVVVDVGSHLTDRSADTADVELTERECGLLAVLASRPTRVFTRAELLERVFDGDSPGAVDTYVSYLRRKLGKDAVVTVHGLGYRRGTA